MAWILQEDNAIKQRLGGVSVSDEKSSNRQVGVWFSTPEPEVRDRMIPFISIDLLDLAFAAERAVGGPYKHDWAYIPDDGVTTTTYAQLNVPNPQTSLVSALPPQPYDFTYQITTWSRHPRHDRMMLAALLGNRLPYQFGSVLVMEDKTVRRLDLVGFSKSDILDGDRKQIFRNVFTVKMSSELFFWQLQAVPTVWSNVTIQGGPDIGSMTPINEVIPFTTFTTQNS